MDFKQFYKTINFDIDNEIRTVYQATQGDTKSRGLVVDLIVGGVKTPVTTETMNFFALKPDGTRVMTVGVKEGTGFRIDFTNQTFAVPGVLLCALVLNGTNGEKIADKKFKMTVDTSLEDGAIVSEDERGILDRAFDLASDIVPRLEALDVPLLENLEQEVTTARGTEATLGSRLDSTDVKLSGIENNILSRTKNLFDGNYIKDVLISYATTPPSLYTAIGGRTAVIPINTDGSKTYHIDKVEPTSRFVVSGCIDEPMFSNVLGQNTTDYDYERTLTFRTNSLAITPPSDVKYLLIQVSVNQEEPKLSVLENSKLTTFIPYFEIDEKIISKELIGDLTFNTTNIKNFKNGNVDVRYGKETTTEADKRALTPLIPMPKGSTINTIDKTEIDGFYGMFFDKNSEEFIGNTGGYADTWEIQEDCYVRLLSRYTDLRVITNPSEFDTRFEIIKTDSSNTNIKQTLFGNFQTLYKTPECEDMRTTLKTKTINDIYDEYDNLMIEFPNQIEKNLLGYGTLNGGGEDNTLPIYEYTFKNPSSSRLSYKSPTILIHSGLHGSEKSPVWSLLQFLKQMMNGSLDNDTLDAIKNAAIYRIIPVANPGGFNANTRRNNNDVDINRNFNYKWEQYEGEEKGVSPYSEEETKILRDWYLEYASDDTFFIDFHNTGEAYNSSYLDTPNNILKKEYSQMMIRLSGRWFQRYNEVGNKEIPNEAYGYLKNSQAPMAQNEAYHIAGIENSALLEIAMDDNGVNYTSKVIERGVDLVANYIQILLRMF